MLYSIASLLAGCAGDALPGADVSVPLPAESASEGLPIPRDRMGCLPFPGLFTLYAKADPAVLGEHHYGRPRPGATPETARGIFYTARGGFLDLAHLRNTIDWTRYSASHVADALARGQHELTLNGSNGSLFHVALSYPPDWPALPLAERQKLVAEMSIRSGERLAYLMLTWHETASWFGDHTFLFDESPSAFTWDDVMSHVVGVRIAEMALRDRSTPFDDAVTFYLAAQLKVLGAVGPDETDQAVDAINGVWWSFGRPLKRQFDQGLESGVVTPWLVPNLPFAKTARAVPFVVPDMKDVLGRDLSRLMTVRIEPRIAAADRMRSAVPDLPVTFDADADLPRIIAAMRTQMRSQFGQLVNVPWPSTHQRHLAGVAPATTSHP